MLLQIVLPLLIGCFAFFLSGQISLRLGCCIKCRFSKVILSAVFFVFLVVCVLLSLRFPSSCSGKLYFTDFISFLQISFS